MIRKNKPSLNYINNALNRSPSKEAHSFGKAERFIDKKRYEWLKVVIPRTNFMIFLMLSTNEVQVSGLEIKQILFSKNLVIQQNITFIHNLAFQMKTITLLMNLNQSLKTHLWNVIIPILTFDHLPKDNIIIENLLKRNQQTSPEMGLQQRQISLKLSKGNKIIIKVTIKVCRIMKIKKRENLLFSLKCSTARNTLMITIKHHVKCFLDRYRFFSGVSAK